MSRVHAGVAATLLFAIAACPPAGADTSAGGSHSADAPPTITSLNVAPGKPTWDDSLDVTVAVDEPTQVSSVTVFMCIIEPNSICYLPKEMRPSGKDHVYSSDPLKSYALAAPTMSVGLKFDLDHSGGKAHFPEAGNSSQFGFPIANTSADPQGLYYKVSVTDSAPPPPGPAKPLAGFGAAEMVVAATAALLVLAVSRARRARMPRR